MGTEDKLPIHVVAILNGSKKVRKFVQEALDFFLQNATYHLEIKRTNFPQHATQLAKEVQQHAQILLVAGGDGTFHEVVNGFDYKLPLPRLILMASGTGNDFLLGLKQQFSVEKLKRCLEDSAWKKHDLIQLHTLQKTYYGINIADIGFGGFVIHLLNKQRKLRVAGKFSYGLAILRAFVRFKIPTLRLSWNDQHLEGKFLLIAICNGSTFGNGLIVNPEANSQDGKLNLSCIGNVSVLDYIKQLPHLKSGQKIIHPEVNYSSCTAGKIEVIAGKAYLEVDGEVLEIGDSIAFNVCEAQLEIAAI